MWTGACRLLCVDEVDCRGMLVSEESDLIGSRCEEEERVFVLLRDV